MKQDHRITLLDKLTFGNYDVRKEYQALLAQRVNARRYIFDIEASRMLGKLVGNCVDLLVDNIEFARTPYPTTYIQYDAASVWCEWRDEPIRASHDTTVGYLIHNDNVLVIAEGPSFVSALPEVAAGIIGFRINRPQAVPITSLIGLDELRSETCKQAYVFGGRRGVPKELRQEYMQAMQKEGGLPEGVDVWLPDLPAGWSHRQAAAHFDLRIVYTHVKLRTIAETCFLSGGDPMILTAALLLLNRPSRYVGMEHVEGRRGVWKGKLKSFKEHHVVTVHLKDHEHVKRMFGPTERASPIAHDVEGHWKHYNKSQGCAHHHPDGRQTWEPVGLEMALSGGYKRYWCPLCLQRRTWTEAFTRGDSSQGSSTTEYAVKP